MSSLAAARADNFYYPPDFDPVKHQTLNKASLRILWTLLLVSRAVNFHTALKDTLGLINGAKYDQLAKAWSFPLAQYKHVTDALTDNRRLRLKGLTINLQPHLPNFVDRMLHVAVARPNDEHLYDLLKRRPHSTEESLDERMMPFQREGVRHALRSGGRILIGDEMGLGKTVQACCIMRCYKEEWPALVVTPKSLRYTWADALFMWLKLTDKDVFVVTDSKDTDKMLGFKVVIVSYDQLSRMPDKFGALKAGVVVLDEAHYIKNGKAQRTQAALPLLKGARRVVLLTGTPALSKPVELVPLMQSLMPSVTIKVNEFCERYSRPDPSGIGRGGGGNGAAGAGHVAAAAAGNGAGRGVGPGGAQPPAKRQALAVGAGSAGVAPGGSAATAGAVAAVVVRQTWAAVVSSGAVERQPKPEGVRAAAGNNGGGGSNGGSGGNGSGYGSGRPAAGPAGGGEGPSRAAAGDPPAALAAAAAAAAARPRGAGSRPAPSGAPLKPVGVGAAAAAAAAAMRAAVRPPGFGGGGAAGGGMGLGGGGGGAASKRSLKDRAAALHKRRADGGGAGLALSRPEL
ncbi:SWI/SNF-related matrix-associated actin-dependent regulator of chromatin subfamily A-like protein 1 [Tetrabaena socialis]|uniref:SWI/SNF-related matrix-associated actin-dependent regulator of chromatin subfamily A-like protein 1 n=1 Tax=Tetrabaena socialis TaxID=47790 RepID=A0A2J8A4D2_9CHLO|nr:SWI/SNF-related matrix-associated actin-dependent regulator of chromatin subfamily A-like protein 1 [Tetrabaena socialis]|eukprot:PNH07365.1 SWI/SNF-related matrix-associated actin-dependent regulator of chromatin subfamily A-like protein 1 [Tetrabaena socialis]